MDPLQQQLMMRQAQAGGGPDAGTANALAHPPLPGAPPASIGAPTPPGPPGAGGGGLDPSMFMKLMQMLKGGGTGMLGAPAPMGGMASGGPASAQSFVDKVGGMPGMQTL